MQLETIRPLTRRQFACGCCAGAAVAWVPALAYATDQFVPVALEPRHHMRFENEYLRVFEVIIEPGDTTLFHEHTRDLAFVPIQGTEVKNEVLDKPEAVIAKVSVGECVQLCADICLADIAQHTEEEAKTRAAGWLRRTTELRRAIDALSSTEADAMEPIGGRWVMSADRDTRDGSVNVVQYNLVSPALEAFVGLSFQYADYCLRFGKSEPGPPSLVSTIKINQAGFTETMDTEIMFQKWFADARSNRLLPP